MLNWLKKIIFKKGANKRNPSLINHFDDLIASDFWPKNKLNQLAEKRLKDLLVWSFENSPFYKKKIVEAGFDPYLENFDWKNFKKIPITTKSDLVNYNSVIQVPPSKFGKTFYCESSGTSGQVLSFIRDENWDSFIRAAQMRGYSWYNVNPWDFNIYFWGYNSSFLKKLRLRILDFLVNRFRIFDYNEKSIRELKKKGVNAVYIEGYSSMIYEMAKLIPKASKDFKKLRLVKATSEKIFPHYKTAVKQAFNIELRSEYGAAEAGIIAFECPEGKMHIVEEGVYVEVGENQELIITNLVSKSFPIIRYQLGDAVVLENESATCACGREHRIIKEIQGRVGKNIYGKTKLFPSLTLYYMFKNIFFQYNKSIDYQAVQYEKGRLEILTLEKLTDIEKSWVIHESNKYFKDEVTVKFKVAKDFRLEKGKLRDFISKIE
ncbi:phenylacetate--CoA ligase family protein [Algoriphagus kandeliae]|uniref:Phenylacetate--CoA ligase family protein n=1 Tax=Algoriphagus kandeliae TaxID=2562278 RepID=A0A4Y9R0A9_9BACT|nr:phenylacetate--CoA ligase family protein [Algoriphagus kandeliae]TFV97222.1 phenylacetate--CoA ligase family protein [Algoriphagus kandeliae]